MTIYELIRNLKMYKFKRLQDSERNEPKKENSLLLMVGKNKSSEDKNNMGYLTHRFQKMVKSRALQNKRKLK